MKEIDWAWVDGIPGSVREVVAGLAWLIIRFSTTKRAEFETDPMIPHKAVPSRRRRMMEANRIDTTHLLCLNKKHMHNTKWIYLKRGISSNMLRASRRFLLLTRVLTMASIPRPVTISYRISGDPLMEASCSTGPDCSLPSLRANFLTKKAIDLARETDRGKPTRDDRRNYSSDRCEWQRRREDAVMTKKKKQSNFPSEAMRKEIANQ